MPEYNRKFATVTVWCNDGTTWSTCFNGGAKEAIEYYLWRHFTVGPVNKNGVWLEEVLVHVVRVRWRRPEES